MCKISILIPARNEPKIYELMDEIENMIGPSQIVVCNDRYGKGKGWAIREALREATGDYYIFIDGDKDVAPREIFKVVAYLKDFDIVAGKKELPKKLGRQLLTFLSRIWIWVLFQIEVDSQTGIKGFNYKPQFKTDGWLFSVEILAKAKRMGKTMVEIPVHATISDTKSFTDVWSAFIDSLKIRWELNGKIKRSR